MYIPTLRAGHALRRFAVGVRFQPALEILELNSEFVTHQLVDLLKKLLRCVPWNIFHSNTNGSPLRLSNSLCAGVQTKLLILSCSQTLVDSRNCGHIPPKRSTESEKTNTIAVHCSISVVQQITWKSCMGILPSSALHTFQITLCGATRQSGLAFGEYLLDLLDIHDPRNTLDLILILMQVYGSPHARNQIYSPNRFVDRESCPYFLSEFPVNFFLEFEILVDSETLLSARSLAVPLPPLFGASVLCMLIDSFPPFASPQRGTCYQLLNADASGLSRLVRLGSELHREDDSPSTRASRFRAGRDFATTRLLSSPSCPSCSCRFHMDENWAKAQVAEGKIQKCPYL